MRLICLITVLFVICPFHMSNGQETYEINGKVLAPEGPLSGAVVELHGSRFNTISNAQGEFSLENIPEGLYRLKVSFLGYAGFQKDIDLASDGIFIPVRMVEKREILFEVEVLGQKNTGMNGLYRLNTLENLSIYSGKKNDLINLIQSNANLSLNNSREIFSKVAGLNVWENDGSGIQLNVSTRGLSPNRSWEFNVRQDGVNIQAEVMGYPDSYYTPTTDAIAAIEVVRGSGALQYGTQMGGLLNFRMKRSRGTGPVELEVKQSLGYGSMYNSYVGIGGTMGKLNYYAYNHHRSGDAWRENSDYKTNTQYGFLGWEVSKKFSIEMSYTRMRYLLHLAAGLTDEQFRDNHRQSNRDRNWFQVAWNLPTLKLSYKINDNIQFEMNNFAILSERNSVENTDSVNMVDDLSERDLRRDTYRNFGSEIKFRSSYFLKESRKSHFTAGIRLYRGNTERLQGLGTDGSDADFSFINPGNLEYNNYDFVTKNTALYIENLFQLTDKFAVTPGIRYEFIKQTGIGYFNDNGAKVNENLENNRDFPMFGIGAEYGISNSINLYSNFTQGFRAIHFNDLRLENPNIQVDQNINDSKGYNLDLGFRGLYKKVFNFDVSLYYLRYNDRVGVLERSDANQNYLFRTNIADSRSLGLETFFEANIWKLFFKKSSLDVSLFSSYSYTDSKYFNSILLENEEKYVEFSPDHILRSGLKVDYNAFSTSLNFSWVSSQFSDANNTVETLSGNNGLIPAYKVADWSCSYRFGRISTMININNVFNEKYFTRRASGYPGPGLIPSDPRGFTFTLTGRF